MAYTHGTAATTAVARPEWRKKPRAGGCSPPVLQGGLDLSRSRLKDVIMVSDVCRRAQVPLISLQAEQHGQFLLDSVVNDGTEAVAGAGVFLLDDRNPDML